MIQNEMVVLYESRPHVARTGAWQTYNDHIQLKPGQEKRKLLITFTNGADSRTKLSGVNIQLARKPFATLNDFNGADTLSRNLTGKLERGKTLLTVQVFGPSGARIAWKLLTEKVTITSSTPNPFGIADKLTVHGKNFSSDALHTKALIGGKAATVVKAKSTVIELKPPQNLSGGQQDLVVIADSVASQPFKVFAKAAPQITWVNFVATAPGQPVTISGRGFSSVASENTVTFGGIRARVVSATERSINCIVPDMHFPKWHVPIKVTSNGMTSTTRATINIDQRVLPNEGSPQL